MFSKISDLLEPKRRKLNPYLLAAIHCVRSWLRVGFTPSGFVNDDVDDDKVEQIY